MLSEMAVAYLFNFIIFFIFICISPEHQIQGKKVQDLDEKLSQVFNRQELCSPLTFCDKNKEQ